MTRLGLGCCAKSVRFFLILINSLFLTMGLIVLLTGLLLKFTSVFNDFTNVPGIDTLVKSSTITGVLTTLLVIGSFCVVISLFGLIGSCCTSKFFLVIYEILIILLFLSQFIALMVVLFSSGKVETEFREGLNKTVNHINKNDTDRSDSCKLSNTLSRLFKCCGSNSPNDFNINDRKECCYDANYSVGCGDKIIKDIKGNYIGYLVVPNVIILGVELFGMIMVPFLIGKIPKPNSHYFG
jgi:hypothetical protein